MAEPTRAQLTQNPPLSETLKHQSMSLARAPSHVRAARHPTFTAPDCLIQPGL